MCFQGGNFVAMSERRRGYLFIEEWMQRLEVGYADVARAMGTSRTNVYRWATEQHRVYPELQEAIARALGLKSGLILWMHPDDAAQGEVSDAAQRIAETFDSLPESTQREVADFVEFKARRPHQSD